MNSIQIFKNEKFGDIRTMIIDGEPWFAGKDIALVLRYSNPQKAIRDHVDEEDRTVNNSFTVHGTPIVLINESGLYSLIMSSKLPEAKSFKHWVTHEILPTIRKHGAYMTPEALERSMNDPDFYIGLLTVLKNERAAKVAAENLAQERQDTIDSLCNKVPLAELRQRVVQIVRKGCTNSQEVANRWNLLYSEFDKKHHVNTNARANHANQNRIEVIVAMDKIGALYELACKLFATSYDSFMKNFAAVR